MVKVKRIVHLQDKNIAEDNGSGAGQTAKATTLPAKDSVAVKDSSASKKEVSAVKREAITPAKKAKTEVADDSPEERRSTRKIKKKRHKYGEEEEGDEDDFMDLLNEVEDVPSRSVTPVKTFGNKFGAKKTQSTPSTGKKKAEFGNVEDSMETPPLKRPRLARGTPKVTATPKKAAESVTPVKKETDSPLAKDDAIPLPGTPADKVSSSEAADTTPPPPPPPVPKETVTFKAGASNPAGLQNLIDFLIRVLKRKDAHGFFAHPPTETMCPGYFSRIEVPMDFDLIQQKFDAGVYKDLPAFRGDAMLLFENAMKYYDSSSVTYHAARKLRHFVRKTTSKDRLLGMKSAFPALLADIGIEELGLDEAELTGEDGGPTTAGATSGAKASSTTGARDDEGNLVVEIDEPTELLADEDLKIEWILKEKEDKSTPATLSKTSSAAKTKKTTTTTTTATLKRTPLADNATSQEILTSWINGVGNAGRKSSTPISNPTRGNVRVVSALPRRDRTEGLTSLSVLNPDNASVHVDANGEALYRSTTTISSSSSSSRASAAADNSAVSSAISLKQMLGRLATPSTSSSSSSSSAPSGLIAGFKEDRRNMLKPVKYIVGSSPFCSFGPAFDSRFANLSKGDSDRLVSSFHAEDDLTFAGDIRKAVGGALEGRDYELDAVDSLLDVLSGGEYRKQPDVVRDRKRLEEAEEKLRKMPTTTTSATTETSAEDAGATTSTRTTSDSPDVDQLLSSTASKIESLRSTQLSRLSRPPPSHLALVRPPSTEELGMAEGVTSLLASMAKKVTPEYLISQRAVFEALGVDLEREVEGKAATEEEEEEEEEDAIPLVTIEGAVEKASELTSRLDAPTTPVAKSEVPQNVFARTFANSAISFVAT